MQPLNMETSPKNGLILVGKEKETIVDKQKDKPNYTLN